MPGYLCYAFTRQELVESPSPMSEITVLFGNLERGDMKPRIYFYNANSVAEDDGLLLIKPESAGQYGIYELVSVLP